MLEALVAGVTDAEQLAELVKARMRAKIPQLRQGARQPLSGRPSRQW
jgi:hypothetical protein